MVNIILFFTIAHILFSPVLPVVSQPLNMFNGSFSVDNVIIRVLEDGSCLVEYYLSVEDYPADIEFEIMGKPVFVEAYSDSTPIPVESSGEVIKFTAISSKVVVKYYTLDLTNKTGYNWRFHVVSQYRVKVVMPMEAMVYSISPEDFDIGLIDNEPAFIFNPGEITIEYILVPVPSQETTTPTGTSPLATGQTNVLTQSNTGDQGTSSPSPIEALGYNNILNYIVLSTIVAIAIITTYILLKKKHGLGGSSIEKLDEIDKTILETLKRHGELTARELLEKTEIPRSTLYRRLSKLKELGLIETRTKAGITYYRIK